MAKEIVLELKSMKETQIILASNSPRRRELLGWMRFAYLVHPADIDETPAPDEAPDGYVQRLAIQKAKTVASELPGQVILAADTTVADGTEILGKPADRADAKRMLEQLRGRVHFVHTGICVIAADGREVSELCTTPVQMREYSNEELEAYLDTGDPMDKAGAYAIQHKGFHPVIKMEGCFACVIGLPLCHVERAMRTIGLGERSEVPLICQKNLQYKCPIYNEVLYKG